MTTTGPEATDDAAADGQSTSNSGSGLRVPEQHSAGQHVPGQQVPDQLAEEDRYHHEAIATGQHHSPHDVLGRHLVSGRWHVTTMGYATVCGSPPVCVRIRTTDGDHAMTQSAAGLWQVTLPGSGPETCPDYRLLLTTSDGRTIELFDGYCALPSVSPEDLQRIRSGTHHQLWQTLGANHHQITDSLGTSSGFAFAVWAPEAQAVRVIGEMNGWDGSCHAMRSLGDNGVWELFIPNVSPNTPYKYQILTDAGWQDKADPMARATEAAPGTASVTSQSDYCWGDNQWMTGRTNRVPHENPLSIYEVHLPSWRPGLGYRELANDLVSYVRELGFTHVQFMPVAQHPFGGSWGYQVTGYFSPLAQLGSLDDFKYLADCCHQAGIGVLLDWVPAHFPRDDWALARFDGSALYEYEDTRRGEHPDWGTLIFNYGRTEVRNFLIASALYWLTECHVDGLRVDAVASMLYLDYSREPHQWTPNAHGGREHLEAIDFLRQANAACYAAAPGIMMIAEESTAWPGVTTPVHDGGLGFGFKWNMGWMHDTLRYLSREPIHRQYHHHDMTFAMVYAWSENYVLPISHDEVVHGKGTVTTRVPGDHWQQIATARAYFAFQWAHPGKKLLFMGQEFGQKAEWDHDAGTDWACLADPLHAGLSRVVTDLNARYTADAALWRRDHDAGGFQWLVADDSASNVLAFARFGTGDEVLVCVVNFSALPRRDYLVPVPQGGQWCEVINTDASCYGGSGVGNAGAVWAESATPDHHHLRLTVPPLAALYLAPESRRSP